MPYSVKHKPLKTSNKDWAVVNKNTGKITGRTTSKSKAKDMVKAIYANKNK